MSTLSFAVPALSKVGELLLALIVRESAITPPVGWTKIVDGLGSGSILLDVFVRIIDGTEPALMDFDSADPEEIQGTMITIEGLGAAFGSIVEDSTHETVTADVTPETPAATSVQAINLALCAWSVSGDIELEPPDGFTVIDTYTSSAVSLRSFMSAYQIVGATGTYTPPPAAASAPASGRSFTLIVRDRLPIKPDALFDLVPGNIGLRP